MSRSTWDTFRVLREFAYEALTLYGAPFQALLLSLYNPISRSRNPTAASLRKQDGGLGCSLVARRYWGNLCDFFSSGYLDVSIPLVSLPRNYVFIAGISRHYS